MLGPEIGKAQNFGFVFGSGYLMIRVPFCSSSEYFEKLRFAFGSSYVNTKGSGSVRVWVFHRWNWKHLSVVAICYGVTVM